MKGQSLRKNPFQRFLAQFIIGVTSGRLHGRLKVEMLAFFKWALRRSVA